MSKKTFHYEVRNQAANSAEILLYGYIGRWEEFDYPRFQELFRNTLKSNKEITIRIHSCGGSVMEGLAIYDLIRSSDCEVTTIIEGMAASMGFVIALSGDKVQINENAFGMAHAVTGGVWGNKSDLLNYVDLLTNCESRLKNIFTERTKASEEQINDWLNSGKDYWLNAEQCVELGIADTIIKPSKKRENQTTENIANKTPEEAFDFFNVAIELPENLKQDDHMKKEALISLLAGYGLIGSLTAQSADNDVENHLKSLLEKAKKADDLSNQLTAFNEERAEALISAALKEGKITNAEKEDWKNDALQNYSLVAKSLERMAGKPDPNAVLNRPKPKTEGQHELMNGRENWTFSEWQAKDPAGLKRLETESNEEFEKLFNAEYN